METNLEEVIEKIKSFELLPIQAAFLETPEFQILVNGNLDCFLKFVKELGEIAVFISDYKFGEFYFIHEAESEILGSYD